MNRFEKFEEVFFSVLYVVVALFAHKKLTYEFSVPKYAILSLGFTILLAASIIYLLRKQKYTIKLNMSHLLFFGFAAAAFLSTINVYRDRPFYFVYSIDIAFYTLLNVFVAVYLANRYNKKDKVIRFMFVMILTAAFISFDALLNFYTGKDIFLGKVGTPLSRASIKATIGNTIFVANYLGMVIPTTLYFILSYSVGITEENKKKVDIKKEYLKVALLKAFATISLILMIITVIVSQTRSEYGGVFLTNLFFFVFYFLFIHRKKAKNEPKEKIESHYPELAKGLSSLQKTLIIFAAVAVAVILVLYNIPSPLTGHGRFTASKRVEAMFSTGSWDERMLAWFSSVYQWKDHKIFGTGIGTYQILTISYMGKIMENHPRFIWGWNNFKRTHNDYFQVLGETGIVGALFIYGLLLYLLVYLFRTLKKLDDADDALLFLAMAMGFADFAIQSFFSFPGHLLPNTITAIFLASVATSDLFNKDDWMTIKINFKRSSFVATSTIVLILAVASTSMRWNYFISEVHFKAGNSAYVAMIELRKAQVNLLNYEKQVEKDEESFYKREGRFAYLKNLQSYKAYKMKQISRQFTNLSDANFEKMRLEEIRKWEEKFKQVKEEIQRKYRYAKEQERFYYGKALKELTKCLSMNHAYGKAYFYLAALSVQPERMEELKNSLSSIGDYEKFFKQEFDIFQKFIHPDKKRKDLLILYDLMKKKGVENVLNTLNRDNVIIYQTLLDSISLYETSLLVFNERNTYKALAARFASLDEISRKFRYVLKYKKDKDYKNLSDTFAEYSNKYYNDFVEYAKITIYNLPASWNRFPDWKHYDARKAVNGEDIYRYFANIAVRIKPITSPENQEFLKWLAEKEIWATKLMDERGVWGVPDMLLDFMHAMPLYYSSKRMYKTALDKFEEVLKMYEPSEKRIVSRLSFWNEKATKSIEKMAENIANNFNLQSEEKTISDLLKSYLQKFSEDKYWVSIAAKEMSKFVSGDTKYRINLWDSVRNAISNKLYELYGIDKKKSYDMLRASSALLIYERYLRFNGHYKLITNDMEQAIDKLEDGLEGEASSTVLKILQVSSEEDAQRILDQYKNALKEFRSATLKP